MRTLNALHLASFVGNLGDAAMHDGEYRTRQADLPFKLNHRAVEVREFIHWRTRAFDASFVAEANDADLVIVGGFSLFQLWRDTTVSGTYLDTTAELFAAIRRPVLFHGLGCDATRGISPVAVARTRAFLDDLLAFDHCRFSLRNDGSSDLIRTHLGARYADAMSIVPDGGLFANPISFEPSSLEDGRKILAINLAGDMPDKRYSDDLGADLLADFAREMAAGIETVLEAHDDVVCVFVPHIYSDLGPISAVLDALDDRLRRCRVCIAGLDQGLTGWAPAFDLYRRAAAVVSMRYHASLSTMGLGRPVYGISTHHKIAGQFAAYGLTDRCVEWTGQGSLACVFETVSGDLINGDPIERRLADVRAQERVALRQYHEDLSRWILEQRGDME